MRIYMIVLAIIGLLFALHFVYPEATLSSDAGMRVLYLSLLALLIGTGFTMQRSSRPQNIRNAGLWVAIIAGLAVAYELLAKISG